MAMVNKYAVYTRANGSLARKDLQHNPFGWSSWKSILDIVIDANRLDEDVGVIVQRALGALIRPLTVGQKADGTPHMGMYVGNFDLMNFSDDELASLNELAKVRDVILYVGFPTSVIGFIRFKEFFERCERIKLAIDMAGTELATALLLSLARGHESRLILEPFPLEQYQCPWYDEANKRGVGWLTMIRYFRILEQDMTRIPRKNFLVAFNGDLDDENGYNEYDVERCLNYGLSVAIPQNLL